MAAVGRSLNPNEFPQSGTRIDLKRQSRTVLTQVQPTGLSPDNCQGDEVHQKGHDGHVWGPVGVIWPQCPALHLTIGKCPFPKYEQRGDGEQEREAPCNSDEDFGLLLCLRKEKDILGGDVLGNMPGKHTYREA